MKSFLLSLGTAFLTTIAIISTSCNPDDPTPTTKEYGKMMFTHVASGAAAVNLSVNGTKITTNALAYGDTLGYRQVEAGTKVNKIVVSKTTGIGVDSVNLQTTKDKAISYYLYIDNDKDKSSRILTSTDDLTSPAANKAKVRFINLISDVPNNIALDLEAVAPGTQNASARNDVTNTKFKEIKDFVEINKGTYDFKIKQTGTTIVLFTATNVSLSAGKIYTFVTNGFNQTANSQKLTVISNN